MYQNGVKQITKTLPNVIYLVIKYTKWLLLMTIKFTNICIPFKGLPKFSQKGDFWFENMRSGNPALHCMPNHWMSLRHDQLIPVNMAVDEKE
jgi:hypothetical protein